MNVNSWGPGGWTFNHNISFNYPERPTEEDKFRYKNYFTNLGDMLPCKYCRNSYKIYTKHMPIDNFLDSREGVTYWLYRMHNLVNQKVFKDQPEFRDVVRTYEGMRAKCGIVNRDNDINKKYKSCQRIKGELNEDYINEYTNYALSNYKELADNYEIDLMKSDENPNIDYLKSISLPKKYKVSYNLHY